MGLHAAMQEVLARLREIELPGGAKLRAFDDAGQVNPPCVWLPTPALEFAFGKGQLSISWQAFVIAPNSNLTSVSPTLSELVDAISSSGLPLIDGVAQTLTLPGGGQPFPAYQLTWSSRTKIGA